ncbi:glycosyl hydrolase family 8 [Natronospora cellulosivora (SeqCode)]
MKRFKNVFLFTLIAILALSVTISAFPYNAEYPYGFSSVANNQQEINDFIWQEWEQWKSERITSQGAGGYRRVQRCAADDFDSVSEGLAYGMLLAVYFNEQDLFDDLYGYVSLYKNSRGLMGWQIDAQGNIVGSGGANAATDADEDIALALIFADSVWGSNASVNYEQEARNFLDALMAYCVEPGTYVLKPGDVWGGSNVTNPSYFAPAWYKVFADFSGNQDWLRVVDSSYDIVENVKNFNSGTGLVPDWCRADGSQASGMGYDFSYDAIRYPWRTAIDYSWYGDQRAKTNVDLSNQFFNNIGVNNLNAVYTITGQPSGSPANATFVSMIAAGSMTGYNMNFAQDLLELNIATKDSGPQYNYYGNSLRLLSLLYMSGNFPNLYEYDGSDPDDPDDPDPEVILGDVNGDGLVNSMDYTLLSRYILSEITEFPCENGVIAADINEDSVVDSRDLSLLGRIILGN